MRRLGLDLGGTDVKLALLEDDEVVVTDTAPTRSEDGGAAVVLSRIVELGISVGPTDSVGVSVPGLIDADGKALLFPNLFGEWRGVPVGTILSTGFGRPTALLNDGHAFALAEARVGAAHGSRDVLCVVCGTGVGGGLVLGGRLHLGVDDRAGEVGHHTVIEDGEPCNCGNRGCLETIAGARAIARAAGDQTFGRTLARARAGDPEAITALTRAGRYLGIAIANLTIFLAPEKIVIGGGVAEAGDLLLQPLREELDRRARNVAPLDRIGVVAAELGPFAGAIGAALYGGDATTIDSGGNGG